MTLPKFVVFVIAATATATSATAEAEAGVVQVGDDRDGEQANAQLPNGNQQGARHDDDQGSIVTQMPGEVVPDQQVNELPVPEVRTIVRDEANQDLNGAANVNVGRNERGQVEIKITINTSCCCNCLSRK